MLDGVSIVAGLVVLAEALNKLERCWPTQRGLAPRERLCQVLKAMAWFTLALGAGGAIARPLLGLPEWARDLQAVLVLLGMAILIVRTRVKEG